MTNATIRWIIAWKTQIVSTFSALTAANVFSGFKVYRDPLMPSTAQASQKTKYVHILQNIWVTWVEYKKGHTIAKLIVPSTATAMGKNSRPGYKNFAGPTQKARGIHAWVLFSLKIVFIKRIHQAYLLTWIFKKILRYKIICSYLPHNRNAGLSKAGPLKRTRVGFTVPLTPLKKPDFWGSKRINSSLDRL